MATSRLMLSDHVAYITLAGLRPRTIRSRREVLSSFVRHIHPRSLSTATKRDVESFLSRDLTASSRRTYLMHLRGFYAWAVEQELVAEDPTSKIKRIRVKTGAPRPIGVDDLALAIDQATPRMRAWVLLMSFAGLRCMEVAALRPCDLIQVDGQMLLYLRETKGGGSATLPAHPAIVEALSLLPVRDNLWWDVLPNTVSTEVSVYLKGLGIDASAHRLRHTAGTAWIRASGHDLLTTAALLRHASVSTTQIYAQLDPVRPAQVVNLVPVPSPQRAS